MVATQEEIKLTTIVVGWGAGIFVLSYLLQTLLLQADSNWLVVLFLNMTGYSSILLPGYLGLRYVRESGYLDRGTGTFASVVRLFYAGKVDTVEEDMVKAGVEEG